MRSSWLSPFSARFTVALIVAATLAGPLRAETDTPTADPANAQASAPTAIPAPELADEAQAVRSRLSRFRSLAALPAAIARVTQRLVQIAREIEHLEPKSHMELTDFAIEALAKDQRAKWIELSGELEQAQIAVSGYAACIERANSELDGIRATWEATHQKAMADGLPPAVLLGIDETLKDVVTVQTSVKQRRSEILVLQNKIGRSQETAVSTIEALAEFVSQTFVNWTLSDHRRRIDVPVGVEYGTDPQRVIEILIEVAGADPQIIAHPEPDALMIAFGDSSLNFELRAWTLESEAWMTVRSRLTVEIDRAFKAAGITIPFPQRDLHIRSGESPAGPARGDGTSERD